MNQPLVKLSLRLPEPERRRFRVLALQRGLTAEQALRQAADAWMSRAATADLATSMPRPSARTTERAANSGQPKKRQPKTNAAPSRADSRASNARPAKPGAPSWSLQAMRLNWSQCPAAELVDTKQGKRWVFRGTRVLLADLFYNLERGHSVEEVVAHFKGLKHELVHNVMQFAGQYIHVPNL